MLTPAQEKYLASIPLEKTISIQPFDPKSKTAAEEIIHSIHQEMPNLEVSFEGSAALGIAGQNDIDLNVLSVPEEFVKYLPDLVKLFGQPNKQSESLVQWVFERNGFEVELYLTDRNSEGFKAQIKVFEMLRDSADLRAEYEQIKLSCDGKPFREYMKMKYEFFNKILNLV